MMKTIFLFSFLNLMNKNLIENSILQNLDHICKCTKSEILFFVIKV